MIEWLMNLDWMQVAQVTLMVLGGILAALWAIAPLTETKWDDKAAGVLTKLRDLLLKLIPGAQPMSKKNE